MDDADRVTEQAERLTAPRDADRPEPLLYFSCRRRFDAPARERKVVLAGFVERWIAAGWVVVAPEGKGKLAIEWPGPGEAVVPVRFPPQRARTP